MGSKIKIIFQTKAQTDTWVEDTFPEFVEDYGATQKDEDFDIKRKAARYAIEHIINEIKKLNSINKK